MYIYCITVTDTMVEKMLLSMNSIIKFPLFPFHNVKKTLHGDCVCVL